MRARLLIAAAFALVLALPFIVRALASGQRGLTADPDLGRPTQVLIVVTPHVEQIRLEFAAAFDRWHRRHHGDGAAIDWRTPGGTSEIIKQLEAQFDAAARDGRIDAAGNARPGSVGFDLFFGGGSFEHTKMKQERKAVTSTGQPLTYRMGRPAGFTQQQLDDWFGDNKIGVQTLYDPDQYWIGTALSGFGIVYNKDVLARRGLPEPTSFSDLCLPGYQNLLALADPRQSGSVTTTFESILNKEGWDRGWRILREMCANTRYFASAGTRPPVDVSQGEAGAGLAIDFYGRGQAQFTLAPGQDPATARVGYVDPAGAVYIDADPVSMLNGAPHPDLARRFIEFCLTEEAQALWQMRAITTDAGASNPPGADGRPIGPERYELRRMPVRRVMYQKYDRYFVDQANPFLLASDLPSRGFRGAIAPMMSAFGVDVTAELRDAWAALNRCRAAAAAGTLPRSTVDALEDDFYAWPTHITKDGAELPFTEANFKTIYADADRFRDTEHAKRTQIRYTRFFASQFKKVSAAAREALP